MARKYTDTPLTDLQPFPLREEEASRKMRNEIPLKSPAKGVGSSGGRWFRGGAAVLALIAVQAVDAKSFGWVQERGSNEERGLMLPTGCVCLGYAHCDDKTTVWKMFKICVEEIKQGVAKALEKESWDDLFSWKETLFDTIRTMGDQTAFDKLAEERKLQRQVRMALHGLPPPRTSMESDIRSLSFLIGFYFPALLILLFIMRKSVVSFKKGLAEAKQKSDKIDRGIVKKGGVRMGGRR